MGAGKGRSRRAQSETPAELAQKVADFEADAEVFLEPDGQDDARREAQENLARLRAEDAEASEWWLDEEGTNI